MRAALVRYCSPVVAVTALLALSACGETTDTASPATTTQSASAAPAPTEIPPPSRLPGIVSSVDVQLASDQLGRWEADTAARPVQVTSTADGAVQDVLWTPPAQPGAPLVVHVHSWGASFDQQIGVPIALWAESMGWGFLQPDFRGPNDDPAATGSTLTTQDVVDAVDFAVTQGVDPARVYVTGFSGGGMMSLLLAGRHADRFAGAAAWVPVYDLVTWYAYNRDNPSDAEYAAQIEASCGGDPTSDPAARDDCLSRSPVSAMQAIRDAGVPVYLGGGLGDEVVPVSDVLRAFNALADPEDRIPDAAVAATSTAGLAPELQGSDTADTRFTAEDPPVLFSRTSGSTTAVVFEGGHQFVYYPGLDWLARLDAGLVADR